MSVILLVTGILMIIGLVVIHEFGHFIMARRNGVEVEEFGIFFPPRLYKRRTKGGWLFSINAIPLGGFVRLKGEHDSDKGRGSFGAASLQAKSKIMAAGVVMNLAAALVLFTIIALVGMPKLIDNQFVLKHTVKASQDGYSGSQNQRVPWDQHLVTSQVLISYVEPGSPADKAGLKTQDEINDIAIAGHSPVGIDSAKNLPKITKAFAGKSVTIYYTRAGQNHETHATLRSSGSNGYLGVVPTEFTLQRYTWSAPIVAAGLSAQLTGLTFQGLGHALGGVGSLIAGAVTGNHAAREHGQTAASDQVAGPVGIFVILKNGSLIGYQFMLFIVAYISLMLAIMNILPVPALDGGRLWITLVARGLKRPLSAAREEAINAAGFALLLGLIIIITILDVKRFL